MVNYSSSTTLLVLLAGLTVATCFNKLVSIRRRRPTTEMLTMSKSTARPGGMLVVGLNPASQSILRFGRVPIIVAADTLVYAPAPLRKFAAARTRAVLSTDAVGEHPPPPPRHPPLIPPPTLVGERPPPPPLCVEIIRIS